MELAACKVSVTSVAPDALVMALLTVISPISAPPPFVVTVTLVPLSSLPAIVAASMVAPVLLGLKTSGFAPVQVPLASAPLIVTL